MRWLLVFTTCCAEKTFFDLIFVRKSIAAKGKFSFLYRSLRSHNYIRILGWFKSIFVFSSAVWFLRLFIAQYMVYFDDQSVYEDFLGRLVKWVLKYQYDTDGRSNLNFITRVKLSHFGAEGSCIILITCAGRIEFCRTIVK